MLNLIADYLSGDNIRAVARKYHVDQHTAGAHLDRHGIDHRPQGQILPAKLEEAARRYNAGENIVAIAKFLKVHPQTARKALVRAGVTIRPA